MASPPCLLYEKWSCPCLLCVHHTTVLLTIPVSFPYSERQKPQEPAGSSLDLNLMQCKKIVGSLE